MTMMEKTKETGTNATKTQETPIMTMSMEEEETTLTFAQKEEATSLPESFGLSEGLKKLKTRSELLYEQYKKNNPKRAAEIDHYVANFDYTNSKHIESFGLTTNRKNEERAALEDFFKRNHANDAYIQVKNMILVALEGIEPGQKKRTLFDRLKSIWQSKQEEFQEIQLQNASLEDLLNNIYDETEKAINDIVTLNRSDIAKMIQRSQARCIKLDLYLIAGEKILEKMEQEYYLPRKRAYENDPESAEAKVAFAEAEQKYADFLSYLNNMIANRAMELTDVTALIQVQQTNKNMERMLIKVRDNTIPAMERKSMISLINEQNAIPMEDAMKITEITEKLMVDSAKAVGETYLESSRQANAVFVSVDKIKEVADILKETLEEGEKIRSENIKIQQDRHAELLKIENDLNHVAQAAAYQIMDAKDLQELEKNANVSLK